MSNDWKEGLMIAVILVGIVVLVAALTNSVAIQSMQKQAISHGAAQYNPTNGNFEWKK